MLRSSNFGIVYVDGKGAATPPRKSLSNLDTVVSSLSPGPFPRQFGSSNIANSTPALSSPVASSRRKSQMLKVEDGEEDQPYPVTVDIGDLIADDADSNQLDGSDANWMHKIDVTQFKSIQHDLITHPVKEEGVACEEDVYGSVCENVPIIDDSHRQGTSRYGRWTKPAYSYSCLVALALKNSRTGQLTVSEIYDFMCENFPFFRTAPPGWKNSVRHNLSLNKCFQKIELYRPDGQGRKSCLWSLNPAKVLKMEQEVRKWRERDVASIRDALLCPDDLEAIEQGLKGIPLSSKLSRNNDDLLRTRPMCPQLLDCEQSPQMPSGYDHIAQPPVKQLKMISPDDTQNVLQDGTMKMCSPRRRERLRSISIPQRGTLIVPEGSTVREVAAKNLQSLLQNHCAPPSHITPVKVRPPPIKITENVDKGSTQPQPPTVFPTINQCVSPARFAWNSPRNENAENDSWYRTVVLSPLSTSPLHDSGICPYDTVTSAINNNSLLRSALERSPCRSLTFTAL